LSPRAEVLRASYFGHDALIELRLLEEGATEPTFFCARTFGSEVPAVGSRVAVLLEGQSHVYPAPAVDLVDQQPTGRAS
jgi:hypothetical protein